MRQTDQSSPNAPSRRDFIKTSAATVAGASLAARFSLAQVHAAPTGELKVGLIGCGGRGTGAARQALLADPNTKLVALSDTFRDQIDKSYNALKESSVGDRVMVGEDHKFTGFDGYKGVIDSCDVILLCEPPAFRPQYLRAAVEAGRHVFCEKPIAVDAPGVRSVLDTCALAAQKNLTIVSGLCYRYEFAKQDTLKRIHDGAVGEIITMQTTYNTGGLWHRGDDPAWTPMEYQVRNWIYFNWLSGDHINEQHIHSLDKIAWVMGDEYPVRATASGGRIVRTDPKYGNVFDHFNTVYEWANGVKGFSSCRQWVNTDTDVSDHVFGTKGAAHIQTHHIETRDGGEWRHQPEGPDDMYQNEHNALFAAIRKGEPINDGDYMCKSTMMAIMGRMSAYTGKSITWDEAINSQESLVPAKLEWGDMPVRPVPKPGVTKLA